jgi:hypothetical protein
MYPTVRNFTVKVNVVLEISIVLLMNILLKEKGMLINI